jgi:hypothetical protein
MDFVLALSVLIFLVSYWFPSVLFFQKILNSCFISGVRFSTPF